MAADRDKAIERLTAGLEILDKQVEPGRPLPKHFVEAQLLLAEIRWRAAMQRGRRPLPAAGRRRQGREARRLSTRRRSASFSAPCGRTARWASSTRPAEVGAVLIDLGPDTPQVNAVLVDFARLLDEERKKAEAPVTELESTTKDAEREAAKDAAGVDAKRCWARSWSSWPGGRKSRWPGWCSSATRLSAVGMTDEASQQYQKIIQRAETDPEFAKTAAEGHDPRPRPVGRPAAQGRQVRGGLKQVDQLIKDNPRALEPLMEKGESWKTGRRRSRPASTRPWPIGSRCGRGCSRFARSRPNTTT